MVLILQGMNYLIKAKASDSDNKLVLDVWNSLNTKSSSMLSKEGVTFHNMLIFIMAINQLYIDSTMRIEEKQKL